MASNKQKPRYVVRPVITPVVRNKRDKRDEPEEQDPFIRPEAEDDDGYDPFSDRPPTPEPTYQEDPWR